MLIGFHCRSSPVLSPACLLHTVCHQVAMPHSMLHVLRWLAYLGTDFLRVYFLSNLGVEVNVGQYFQSKIQVTWVRFVVSWHNSCENPWNWGTSGSASLERREGNSTDRSASKLEIFSCCYVFITMYRKPLQQVFVVDGFSMKSQKWSTSLVS